MDTFQTVSTHQITSIGNLHDTNKLKNPFSISVKLFKHFLSKIFHIVKTSSINAFNVSLLVIIYNNLIKQKQNDNDVEFLKLLRNVISASNIILTDMSEYTIFTRKLKLTNSTDDCDFLILPVFSSWDKTFITTLYKYLFELKNNRHIAIGTELQKVRLLHGTILEQIQNKDSFSGQHVYGHYLNKRSQISNVICYNSPNYSVLPEHTVSRYYGRQIKSNVTLRCKSTRHPNISQLSTHTARIDRNTQPCKNNIRIGLGTFLGANRDCDGDKEITTLMPYPNSVLYMESMLYDDPEYCMIQFDKTRLSFCPQQILYLYRIRKDVDKMLTKYNLIYQLWQSYEMEKFSTRLQKLLYSVTLSISSRVAYYLYAELIKMIDTMSVICTQDDIDNMSGVFEDIVASGAKGSIELLNKIRNKKSDRIDVKEIHENARQCLNHSVESLNSVRKAGQNIYKSATMLDGVYIDNYTLYQRNKQNNVIPLDLLSDNFLFDNHVTKVVINSILNNNNK
ncbi:late expression factor 9 [Neodiprion sertifer nucleopolyhedrovirus]|uniref:Late expression factor 9 n=1 Tax=Neodiprion sertifer nucleopolyhedrovirus TaxID=111874 RepID=Q6JKC0_9CBAC|nr:late expression factor 9 [Neodiprion sertifer nucleopolyhedrovirus]AAQ96417.1 late expression factor 9 [Neodiprion sertifer nucleopolyhedrovirus]